MQEAIITPEVQDFLSSLLKYRAVKVVYCLYQLVANVIGYFVNGHAIVDLGHKIVLVAGRIAESALLGATLWVTAHYVAHDFMETMVGGNGNANTLSSLSTLAFSLLPEVIVFSAIVITYEHWHNFFRDRRWLNPSWVWAALYTVPTCTFVTMTVIVLCSFAVDGPHTPQATGQALVIRYLAGWAYSIIGLIYSRIGKRSNAQNVGATGQPQSVNQTPDYQAMMQSLVDGLRAEMQSSLSSLRGEISAQKTAIDYAEIVSHMMPTLNNWRLDIVAKVDGLEAQIPQPIDLPKLACELAPLLEKVEKEVINQETSDVNESEESSQVKSEETRDNVVNFRVSSQSRKQSTKKRVPGQQMSEAEREVRRYLSGKKILPNRVIAQKAKVTPSYVSKIKRKMVAEKLA